MCNENAHITTKLLFLCGQSLQVSWITGKYQNGELSLSSSVLIDTGIAS